jgi:hypothetical protein
MADVFKLPKLEPQPSGVLKQTLVGVVNVSAGSADAGKVVLLNLAGQIDPSMGGGGSGSVSVNSVVVTNPNLKDNTSIHWAVVGSDITASVVGGSTAFQVNGTPVLVSTTINFESGTGILVTNPSAGNIQFTLSPPTPQTIGAVASKWLNSYNAVTGLFTATQPAYGDISGIATGVNSQIDSHIGGKNALNGFAGLDGSGLLTVIPASTAPTHKFANGIAASGALSYGQPSFTDMSDTLTGDVTSAAASTATTLVKLQGIPLLYAPTPATGQVLEFDGVNWTPTNPIAAQGTILFLSDVDDTNYDGEKFTLSQVGVVGGTVTYTGTITGGGSNDLTGKFFSISGFATAGNNTVLLTVTGASFTGSSLTLTGAWVTGAGNAYAGTYFDVTGFDDPPDQANNGLFICTASSAGSITLTDAAGLNHFSGSPKAKQLFLSTGSSGSDLTFAASTQSNEIHSGAATWQYKGWETTAEGNPEASTALSITAAMGNTVLEAFVTEFFPNVTLVPSGTWQFDLYLSTSVATGTQTGYVEVLALHTNGTETSLFNTSGTPFTISGLGTGINLQSFETTQSTFSILTSDVLVLKVWITTNTTTTVAVYHNGTAHYSHVHTTFGSVVSAVLSVNGQTGVVLLSLENLIDVSTSPPTPTNGDVLTWVTADGKWENKPVPSASPGLPFNSIQYNNAGVFGGSANFAFDGSSVVTLAGEMDVDTLVLDHTNKDVVLVRDAAGILALKNGTVAQGLRVYQTTTGPKFFQLSSDATGSLVFGVGAGTSKWSIDGSSFGLLATIDNSYDIGAAGATRPRAVYVGTAVVTPEIDVDTIKLDSTNKDVVLIRDGAPGILALKNGTNPQDLRVYGTTVGPKYTSFKHDGTDAVINSVGGGTIKFDIGSSPKWQIDGNGNLLAFTDNSWDVGQSGATRPRHVYVGTDVTTPAVLITTNAGTVTVRGQTGSGTYSFSLPTSAGSSGNLLSTDGTGVLSWVSPGAATLPTISTVTTTNDSYTAGQRRTYDLTMAKTFSAWRVTEAAGKKFRLQLYETSLARSNDAARPFTVPLDLGTQHGCILDLYIEQSLAITPFKLTPVVVGSNNDGPPQTSTIFCAVTSVETGTENISATISFVAMES